MTLSVAVPRVYGDPFVVTISAVSAFYPVVTLWRVGITTELVQGTPLVLDATGAGTVVDALYPLSGAITYELHDSAGTVVLDTAGPFDPPQPTGEDAGKPQIIDVTQSTRRSAIEVIGVTGRLRRGRVSVFETVGVSGFTTVGDVRLLSAGTLGILFRSHAERNRIIAALSSGGPVVMRVPADCWPMLDEMWFAPQDISEEPTGRQGAGVLSVDFVEVAGSPTRPLPPSVHVITYAEQTANATSAAMTYEGLALAFTARNYAAMSLSRTGIAP